ncbi:MAG: ABC transporter ATP-binding protein [Deltaproteobacteria bacterium]|nr:ABC transporter ATP-binding protein [Deltaproteobacteria bacterium]MBW2218226.1 ABC transporter ATP-binding protein [Deltaproteobacteria bacterium]
MDTNEDRFRGKAPLISGHQIFKSFYSNGSRIDVLKGIDFNINIGETIAVVGASGIGKSTLLHILGTLDRPDSGKLNFNGKDVFQMNDISLARHRNESVGFVFQFHHLLPEFSALENTMMPALIKGFDKQESRYVAEGVLIRVGLKERIGHKVNRLSGGEQQRVALARALVLKPVLLLADEPTGNLDKRNSSRIHELLMELNQELSMTLVVVTHNTELASLMSSNVTIVDGKLQTAS